MPRTSSVYPLKGRMPLRAGLESTALFERWGVLASAWQVESGAALPAYAARVWLMQSAAFLARRVASCGLQLPCTCSCHTHAHLEPPMQLQRHQGLQADALA